MGHSLRARSAIEKRKSFKPVGAKEKSQER